MRCLGADGAMGKKIIRGDVSAETGVDIEGDDDFDQTENRECEESEEDDLHNATRALATAQVSPSMRGCHPGDSGGFMATLAKATLQRSPRSQGKDLRASTMEDEVMQKPTRMAKHESIEGDGARKRKHNVIGMQRTPRRVQEIEGIRSGTFEQVNEHSEVVVAQPLKTALVMKDGARLEERRFVEVYCNDGRAAVRAKQDLLLYFDCLGLQYG